MNMNSCSTLLILFGVLSLLSLRLEAQLQVGFYSKTCPSAERIVKEEVMNGFKNNQGIAPGLIRMHFHDCFVRGCDASILIDSTSSNKAEKDSPANNPSLRGFEVIDSAKARLETACKGVVSCADILAFAARDSVAATKGACYDVPSGRRDGRVSLSSEVLKNNVPGPSMNVSQLIQSFTNKGLTLEEMVTLSGAHTIGRSHCSSFKPRLFNFSSSNGADPTLDANLAAQLQKACPQGNNDSSLVVPMDPATPSISDVNYYNNLLANKVLFTSDQTLLTNTKTASEVNANAKSQSLWNKKFAAAMMKMGQVGVVTGSSGEIRTNCRMIN